MEIFVSLIGSVCILLAMRRYAARYKASTERSGLGTVSRFVVPALVVGVVVLSAIGIAVGEPAALVIGAAASVGLYIAAGRLPVPSGSLLARLKGLRGGALPSVADLAEVVAILSKVRPDALSAVIEEIRDGRPHAPKCDELIEACSVVPTFLGHKFDNPDDLEVCYGVNVLAAAGSVAVAVAYLAHRLPKAETAPSSKTNPMDVDLDSVGIVVKILDEHREVPMRLDDKSYRLSITGTHVVVDGDRRLLVGRDDTGIEIVMDLANGKAVVTGLK